MNRKRDRLDLVQVYRGAAALLVMLYHVGTRAHLTNQPFLGDAFGWGYSGVDFFFVLSGFIMLYVYYDRAGCVRDVPRFVMLRATRIFPLYWLVLGAMVLGCWLQLPTAALWWGPPNAADPVAVARAALLLDPQVAIVPVSWTLSYELVFYGFFALYLLGGAAVFWASMVAWSVLLAAQAAAVISWPHPVLLRLVIGNFFAGGVAALLVKRYGTRLRSGWWLAASVGVVLVLARANVLGLVPSLTLMWAVPYGCLLLFGAAYDEATRRRYPRVLVFLGEASYALYLTHYGLITIFVSTVDFYRPLASVHPDLTLLGLAAVILLVASAVHVYVERPLLAHARRAFAWE